MIQELSRLQNHPFNLIGLADREKFHTGMLGFLLNSLLEYDNEIFQDLCLRLWPGKPGIETQNETIILVEEKGIDLVIMHAGSVTHWAEMKLKTGLGNEQIQRYEKKHPDSKGVLLGLFPENSGSEKTQFRSFPEIISDFLQPPTLRSIAKAGLDDDRVTLIRMWSEYLSLVGRIATDFGNCGVDKIEKGLEIRQQLRNIKLLGIFERYRYSLVERNLDRLHRNVVTKLFNTNGNAGIELEIAGDFPYGLQWQAGALKFFVIDPNYKNGKITEERDALLQHLSTKYLEHFNLPQNKKLNQMGKFRSITVQRWDVLDDCNGRARFLADSIEYLNRLKN